MLYANVDLTMIAAHYVEARNGSVSIRNSTSCLYWHVDLLSLVLHPCCILMIFIPWCISLYCPLLHFHSSLWSPVTWSPEQKKLVETRRNWWKKTSKTNTTTPSLCTEYDWRIWKPPEDFQQTQCPHIFQTIQHTRTITLRGSNTKTQSNIVYTVWCNEECPDLYIKETKQLLHKRIEGQNPQGRLQMVQLGSERGTLEHPSLQGHIPMYLLLNMLF